MTTRLTRVLLAGDGGPVAAALRQKLKTIPGFKIVGAAVNNEDALAQINSHRPHAVIISLP